MHEGRQSLSEREIETLRLLLAGHDAKSVARTLGLSVHTVNDRLRDARRKLGVSSSREAARLIAKVEELGPQFSADKKIGVGGDIALGASGSNLSAGKFLGVADPAASEHPGQASKDLGARISLAWLAGGMVVMSLIVAPFVLGSFAGSGGDPPAPPAPAPVVFEPAMDLMPIADTNNDGKVTDEEYRFFSEHGWGVVSQGRDQVKWAELDQSAQVAFVGITPNAEGVITRQMYLDAVPGRFRMFDRNGDGALSSVELNGRAFLN